MICGVSDLILGGILDRHGVALASGAISPFTTTDRAVVATLIANGGAIFLDELSAKAMANLHARLAGMGLSYAWSWQPSEWSSEGADLFDARTGKRATVSLDAGRPMIRAEDAIDPLRLREICGWTIFLRALKLSIAASAHHRATLLRAGADRFFPCDDAIAGMISAGSLARTSIPASAGCGASAPTLGPTPL